MQADSVMDFDPFEPGFHDDPYPRYRMLLENAPVFHDPRHDMWFIARHDDCLAMFRDAKTYSNVTRMSAGFLPMIATMDPPRHDEQRRVVSPIVAAAASTICGTISRAGSDSTSSRISRPRCRRA